MHDCLITNTDLSKKDNREIAIFTIKGHSEEISDLYHNMLEKIEQCALKSSLDTPINTLFPKEISTTPPLSEIQIETELKMDLLKLIENAAQNAMITKLNVNYLLSYIKEAKESILKDNNT